MKTVKRCVKCEEIKDISCFHRNSCCRGGHLHSCSACQMAQIAQWKAAHPERQKLYTKVSAIRRKIAASASTALALAVVLAGCTTATIETTSEEGIITKVHFTRFASSVGFQMSPEGLITYTSSPETQAANALAGAVLNMSRAIPGATP